jgi:xanthine dehydrogenase/oxidase
VFPLLAITAADQVIEGTIKMGGQEHFYLEPNGAIVIPTESDEYLLISSTQAPTKHQVCRAEAGIVTAQHA